MLSLAGLPAMAAEADPTPVIVAQAGPPGRPGIIDQGGRGPENQSPNPRDNTSGDQTLQQQSLPISVPPRVGLFPEFGKTLLDDGIDIHGIAFDHFVANPSTGAALGFHSNLGAIRPAADFDLGRLFGATGANIHLGLSFFVARDGIPQAGSEFGGFLTAAQTTPAVETNVVSLLTYEQRFLNDRLSLEAGRTNVYNYFRLPNSIDPFTNFATVFQVDGDFNSAPFPVWGGRATYKVTPNWYVQAGAFEDNFRSALMYGDRFGTRLNTGAQILAEVGQRSEFSNSEYPSNFEAGFEWNTRTGRANLKGTGAPAIPLFQRTNYPGGGDVYLQGLKTVWRGAKRDLGPPANIAIYGSVDTAVDKPQPIDFDTIMGVNFTGFIPGRPLDAVGLQAHYQRLSQAEVNSETLKTLILTGKRGASQKRDGFGFEVVGNIQVTQAIAFRPLVEYIVNPDNYYPATSRVGGPRSGFEAGFFAIVSLGRLLGTSLKPF